MEFKNSLINKYAWFYQNQHYCKYIYVIFKVFDPGHLFKSDLTGLTQLAVVTNFVLFNCDRFGDPGTGFWFVYICHQNSPAALIVYKAIIVVSSINWNGPR